MFELSAILIKRLDSIPDMIMLEMSTIEKAEAVTKIKSDESLTSTLVMTSEEDLNFVKVTEQLLMLIPSNSYIVSAEDKKSTPSETSLKVA